MRRVRTEVRLIAAIAGAGWGLERSRAEVRLIERASRCGVGGWKDHHK